jgi:large exoprotein involved in heme utilization and adhesion
MPATVSTLIGAFAYSDVNQGASGNGGNINITTGSLSVTNGALLSTDTYGTGDAGSVNIHAHETVSFMGVMPLAM